MPSHNLAQGLHQVIPNSLHDAVKAFRDRLWQGICHERVTVTDTFSQDIAQCQQPATHLTYDVFEHQFYPVCQQHI